MPIISVIVPVYNCEKYLDRCIESVLNQTFCDWELILVDDGSTDITSSMCDMWADKEKRIRAVHKKNGGTASARNFGVEISQGEYIAFLDNDDWYEPQMLEQLYSAVTQNDVLLAACNYYVWRPEGRMARWPFDVASGKYPYEKILENTLRNLGPRQVIWNMLLHSSIAQKVKFPNVYWEDTAVYYKFYYFAKECVYINEPLYNYERRNISSKGSVTEKRIFDVVNAREYYYWIRKIGLSSLEEQALNVYFWGLFDVLAQCAKAEKHGVLFYRALILAKFDSLWMSGQNYAEQYKIQGKALRKGYKRFLECRREHNYY